MTPPTDTTGLISCPLCQHIFTPRPAPAPAKPEGPPAEPARPNGVAAVRALFGEPGNVPLAKARAPEVFRRLPYLAKGFLTCHKLLVPKVEWVFAELERRGLASLIKSYDGCYNPRKKRGGTSWSTHAWGIALDLNAGDNPMGAKPKLDRRIVAVFEEAGFFWGGRWKSPDGMHFQYATGI
jgi:hypothetical protein